jgi:hypothetical protein
MRTKIILPNLFAVLIVGLASFLYLGYRLRSESEARLVEQLEVTSQLFLRSEALRGYELLFDVRKQSMTNDVTQAFMLEIQQGEAETPEDFDKRARQEWFKAGIRAVEMYSELWAEKVGKKPELVFITDRHGVAIARNTTPNACPAGRNVTEAMPLVARALDGESSYGIWWASDAVMGKGAGACKLINTKLLEVAAAPVVVGDNIAGALVIGFEVSNGVAKEKKDMLGLDVAVVVGGQTYSSSFDNDTARQTLETALAGPFKDKVTKALSTGQPSEIFEIEVEDETYLARVTPSQNADQKDLIVNVLMGSKADAAYFTGGLYLILVFMIVGALVVIFAGVLLGSHFLKPVMEIEEGLLKVINGEYDYRFDVKSSEVGGLSYRINQLVGVLTGEEEEEEGSE